MDISGSLTQMYLPVYYALAAEIHGKQGRPALALAEIKAAQTIGQEVRAETLAVEGSLWRGLGLFKRAEEALLEARRRGHAQAEEDLRGLYRERRGTEEGFPDWLAEAGKSAASVSGSARKPAPAADFRTMDGSSLRLADLKGKVVVLNFWYVGCAPCRVEIPGLNKLVEEFAPRDVVFLGLALDKAPALEEFLKDNAFAYRIVPESQSLAAAFGVSIYPTHILINKQGEIEFFLTGGSPKRHDDLRPLIESLLK
jgi:peroxiredoxin